MLKFQSNSQLINVKLTAMWAVSESGLGGLLHAIKVPFSGLFLGGFAIIIITYLASVNSNRFSAILQATLLVVLIKAIVSPHSPPMAYVAVLFQGILGASIYGLIGINRLSAIGFGAIALLESAFQKILTLTIIFGMGLWESVQQFFEGMQNKLQADWIADLPWLFLVAYGILYFIVGALVGNFAVTIPKKVKKHAEDLNIEYMEAVVAVLPSRKRKRTRIWLIIGLLLFSTVVFIISGSQKQALVIVLRTFAVIVFFLYLINPLFKYLISKWVGKQKSRKQESLNTIMSLMPSMRNNIALAQHLSKAEKGIWKRATLFVINWLSLSLYYTDTEESN